MSFLQFLPIFCILLFTFTRTIDIRVTKSEELTVKINLNIFAILLTEERIRKRGIQKATRLLRALKNLIRPFEYLLSKTEIRLYRLASPLTDSARSNALYTLPVLASLSLLVSYLERNARKVRFTNSRKEDASREETFLDFSLHFSLWNLIIFTLLFLYYTVKSKVKRVIQNV